MPCDLILHLVWWYWRVIWYIIKESWLKVHGDMHVLGTFIFICGFRKRWMRSQNLVKKTVFTWRSQQKSPPFTQQNQREIIGQGRNTTFTACLIELKIWIWFAYLQGFNLNKVNFFFGFCLLPSDHLRNCRLCGSMTFSFSIKASPHFLDLIRKKVLNFLKK